MQTDLTFIQHAPDRFERYRELDTVSWAPSLGAWVCADPVIMKKALSHKNFAVLDFRTIYEHVCERTKINLDATLSTLDFVALGLEGQEHRDVRRMETLHLKERAAEAHEAFVEVFKADLATVMAKGGEIDLAPTVMTPAVNAMFAVLSGTQSVGDHQTTVSQAFDRMLSLNRRKDINRQIDEMLAGDAPPTRQRLMEVSLAIVGADSIYSSFLQSLMVILQQNDGKRLSEIDWPEHMPQTGVPYADRIAVEDIEFAGQQIKAGDRIRLYIEASAGSEGGQLKDLFGMGGHVCLGKAITMRAWTAFITELASYSAKMHFVAHEFRKADYLFNAPKKLEVRIDHG